MPTLPPGGEYLTRVWRDSVYPLAERLGVTMRLPPVQPRSRRAHEATKWAASVGRFDEYNESVFRAFFERGEDIGDTELLARLATAAGLDGEGLRRTLDLREFEGRVLADEHEAQMLGVRGVPAFIANRHAALSGVQSAAALQTLVDRVRPLL